MCRCGDDCDGVEEQVMMDIYDTLHNNKGPLLDEHTRCDVAGTYDNKISDLLQSIEIGSTCLETGTE